MDLPTKFYLWGQDFWSILTRSHPLRSFFCFLCSLKLIQWHPTSSYYYRFFFGFVKFFFVEFIDPDFCSFWRFYIRDLKESSVDSDTVFFMVQQLIVFLEAPVFLLMGEWLIIIIIKMIVFADSLVDNIMKLQIYQI